MSSVYAGGVKATALAAIKAAASARFVEIADGTMDLDRESLTAWLQEQFNAMITDAEATSSTYVSGVITGSVPSLVANLSAVLYKDRFARDPRWPGVFDPSLSDGARIAGVVQQQAILKSMSQAINGAYSTAISRMSDIVASYFTSHVVANMPPTTERIVFSPVYIYTYVSDRAEESVPSLASAVVDCDLNDTRDVTCGPPPSNRNVTYLRLYRSVLGNTTSAYLLVPNPDDVLGWLLEDLDTDGSGNYIVHDSTPAENLEGECPSFTWDSPPDDFRGAVSMANGITVGYSGNTVCLSLAYRPFAYPLGYRKTTNDPIVGICALDELLVVGTVGALKMLYGGSPELVGEISHNTGQSLISARSMVAMSTGVVVLASPDGLVSVSTDGVVKNITGEDGFNLFSREDWQALTPASIFAAELEGCYIFHVPAGFCYVLDLATGKMTTLNVTGSAFYLHKENDTLYLAQGSTLVAVNRGTGRRTGLWKSKKIILSGWSAWQWLQVNSDFTDDVTVRIYRDDDLWVEQTVTSRAELMLPPQQGVQWEIEVETTARVEVVNLAEGTDELMLS